MAAGEIGPDRLWGLHQPGVTLSNIILCAAAVGFAAWLALAEAGAPWLRLSAVGLFASLAVAAGAGALVHGVYPDPESAPNRRWWRLTQLSIGLAAVAAWILAARLGFDLEVTRWVAAVAAAGFLAYVAVIFWLSQSFLVTIVYYLPSILFLLGVLLWRWVAGAGEGAGLGLGAVALSLVAAWVQAVRWSPAPGRLDPNTVYHGLQTLSLALLFLFVVQRLP